MTEFNVERVVAGTKDYYDGPADQIYRTIWGDNIHLGLPCSESCPHPEAMQHTNETMAKAVSLGRETRVLDLGCGYGSTARFLASNFGCHVTGTNISEKELGLARERSVGSGVESLLEFEYGDFHDLKYADGSFDVVWSQEAFLHGANKKRILSECRRVLVPGGTLAFTDILVSRETSDADRTSIYDRVKSPEMWDLETYQKALIELEFRVLGSADWSSNVARSYGWIRDRLTEEREALLPRVGAETIQQTLDALGFWVESAESGKIGWAFLVAETPANPEPS
ncbi:MAG: methyltransferase domain-containing protein [Chloroflexi bacterium]|nr:methyltransferase domain-containing protein [Chloroflexota bacterium]MDA1271859.1 methyltransferase domain-containing protein [Chloroflexota bacterium]